MEGLLWFLIFGGTAERAQDGSWVPVVWFEK